MQVADDGVFDAGTSSSDELSVSLPVRRDQLHGAGVMPERYVGKFINLPSERTMRQECAPQAWAQEATPAVRTAAHQKRHLHAPGVSWVSESVVHACRSITAGGTFMHPA